jgi:hypothetical protein
MKKLLYFLFVAVAFMNSGCFSFSNLQSAKTLGKGESEFGVSVGYIGFVDGSLNGTFPVPTFEFQGKYGVSEKVDIGLKFSNIGISVASLKYQFSGDQSSKFAAATGLGLGGTLVGFNLGDAGNLRFFQVEVPLHLSYHPTDKFALYFSPKYFGIGGAIANDAGMSHLLFLSPGLEFGKRFKFGAEFNIGAPLNDFGLSSGLITQFGLGFKVIF